MQWQEYDNALLSELQLPEFLLHSAIGSYTPYAHLSNTYTHVHVHINTTPFHSTLVLYAESCSSEERVPVQQFEREAEMMERYQLHMSSLKDKYKEIKEGDQDFSELLEVPGIESKVMMEFPHSLRLVTDMCFTHTCPSPPYAHMHTGVTLVSRCHGALLRRSGTGGV